jgi:hypothetical protein
MFFTFGPARWFFKLINCVSSHAPGAKSSDASFARIVCSSERPIFLLPGGHHECYKPASEKYVAMWKELPGYARALLAEPDRPGSNTKVFPVFTNNCEEIFYSTNSWYDWTGKLVREEFHDFENGKLQKLVTLLPKVMLAFGFCFLPMPVKLDLYIGDPLVPEINESAIEFAQRVRTATQKLIDDTRHRHNDPASLKEKSDRSMFTMILRHPFYASYVIIQNVLFWLFNFALVIAFSPIILIAGYFYSPRRKQKKEE